MGRRCTCTDCSGVRYYYIKVVPGSGAFPVQRYCGRHAAFRQDHATPLPTVRARAAMVQQFFECRLTWTTRCTNQPCGRRLCFPFLLRRWPRAALFYSSAREASAPRLRCSTRNNSTCKRKDIRLPVSALCISTVAFSPPLCFRMRFFFRFLWVSLCVLARSDSPSLPTPG